MKTFIKRNYKFIIFLLVLCFILTIKLPYYIYTPGGISDINDKIEINGYNASGTLNLAYVKEYHASVPTLLISLFNKDWKVLKRNEVILNTENEESYELRDRILLEESISNAIYVAYNKANKSIKIKSSKILVTYLTDICKTDLVVGDKIMSINSITINTKQDITNIINGLNIGDKLEIKVLNNNKEYSRYAYIINDNNSKKIGVLLSVVNEYETNPKVVVNVEKNESGSSGGLITALSIYNSLTKEDITKGLTIVGTGTIDVDGNIGSIGGVEYKLKSAVKNNADLFIVPQDENYDEVIRLKNENKYSIKIVGVSNIDECIDYLKSVNG